MVIVKKFEQMKVIYLDQFVVRKCFCPDANEPHKAFFQNVASICMKLARKQEASFPFSESHLRETSTVADPKQRESLIKGFQTLSNGYQFIPHARILAQQAKAVLNASPIDWSARSVLFRDSLMDFRQQVDSTDIPDRNRHHDMLQWLFVQWQELPKPMFDSIAQREADTYGNLLQRDIAKMFQGDPRDTLNLLASPHCELFSEISWNLAESGSADPAMEAFLFVRDRAMEIPSIRLASDLWASFAKSRRRDLDKTKNPANTAEDIHFVSCFVPYCDAAFVDTGMSALLMESKLMTSHKTAIFSLNDQAEFLKYLALAPRMIFGRKVSVR